MDLLPKVIEAVAVIVVGLAAGYLARRRGWLPSSAAPRITRFVLAYVNWAPIVLALWSLPVESWYAATLPVIFVVQTVLLWPVAYLATRVLKLDNEETATLIPAAMFGNQGLTYGSFVCYIAMGPAGLALATLYLLPFGVTLYTLGFAVPGRYVAGRGGSLVGAIKESALCNYRRNPLLAVLAGLGLALLKVPQPGFVGPTLHVLIPLSAVAMLFAIGLTVRLSTIKHHLSSLVAMHVLRFVISPIIGIGLALLLGFWGQPGHDFMKVMIIQSAAPSAIMSLTIVQALGLKADLANACWLTTNLIAIPLAGVLVWMVGLL